MIVLDASVLIAHLDGGDRHHAAAQSLLETNSQAPLGASLQRLGVDELALGENAPGRLAQLRTDTGLKLPDCCVLLAAQNHHDASVASFDTDLLKAARNLGLATAE